MNSATRNPKPLGWEAVSGFRVVVGRALRCFGFMNSATEWNIVYTTF